MRNDGDENFGETTTRSDQSVQVYNKVKSDKIRLIWFWAYVLSRPIYWD